MFNDSWRNLLCQLQSTLFLNTLIKIERGIVLFEVQLISTNCNETRFDFLKEIDSRELVTSKEKVRHCFWHYQSRTLSWFLFGVKSTSLDFFKQYFATTSLIRRASARLCELSKLLLMELTYGRIFFHKIPWQWKWKKLIFWTENAFSLG